MYRLSILDLHKVDTIPTVCRHISQVSRVSAYGLEGQLKGCIEKVVSDRL